MKARLREVEGYQRETLIDPLKLGRLAELAGCLWADLLPDYDWIWEDLSARELILPPDLLDPFVLHFKEGLSVDQVARKLRVSRSTVNRRLQKALKRIKEQRRGRAKSDKKKRRDDEGSGTGRKEF